MPRSESEILAKLLEYTIELKSITDPAKLQSKLTGLLYLYSRTLTECVEAGTCALTLQSRSYHMQAFQILRPCAETVVYCLWAHLHKTGPETIAFKISSQRLHWASKIKSDCPSYYSEHTHTIESMINSLKAQTTALEKMKLKPLKNTYDVFAESQRLLCEQHALDNNALNLMQDYRFFFLTGNEAIHATFPSSDERSIFNPKTQAGAYGSCIFLLSMIPRIISKDDVLKDWPTITKIMLGKF
jgi:hypothetical protein